MPPPIRSFVATQYVSNGYYFGGVVNGVNYSIVANPDAVKTSVATQSQGTRGARISTQFINCKGDTLCIVRVQVLKFTFGTPSQKPNLKGHPLLGMRKHQRESAARLFLVLPLREA